jgi:hypothetical protein
VSARRILTLLVVLALFLPVLSAPAGSATLQQPQDTVGAVSSGPSAKEGGGGEGVGGDDDRWGNTNPDGGDDDSNSGAVGENDDEFGGNARLLGNGDLLRIELRALFGFLVTLL